MNNADLTDRLGFVVIGRNEGERLKSGLRAIQEICPGCAIVYVDSGSTDDSVAFARSLGIQVVELDMSIPFTAARARNAGFNALIDSASSLEFVQFMDGDCRLLPQWPAAAVAALETKPGTGIVSGRRIEQFPESTVYNAIMDIEWNTQPGETRAVLGDMCVRTSMFREIGGFRDDIIAAEDDDVCLRARRAGYRVFRLDADMSVHDANIRRLGQWYRRSMRGGHGFANINRLHGSGPDQYFRRELRSVIVWGGVFPFCFILMLAIYPAVAAAMAAGYVLLILRAAFKRYRLGDSIRLSLAYGVLIYTGKIPEFIGAITYWKNSLLARDHTLIEYK